MGNIVALSVLPYLLYMTSESREGKLNIVFQVKSNNVRIKLIAYKIAILVF